MAKGKREVIGTNVIHQLLANRFSAPEWALLQEVRNQTGFGRVTRTADAFAMNLYPSRGMELYGFEIKVSRGDLRKELADPDKAKEIMQYCDRWYLVIGHKDLIQPGELPPTWGLMVAQKNRIVIKTEAKKLEATPLARGFIASILRNFTQCYVSRSMLDSMVLEKWREWQSKEEERNNRRNGRAESDLASLQRAVAKFQQASGVDISNTWMSGRIGEAVKMVMATDFGNARKQLEQLAMSAQNLATQAERELEIIDQIEGVACDSSN